MYSSRVSVAAGGALTLLTLLATAPALAAETGANKRAAAFDAVLACQKEKDDQARLKCYDAAAASMSQAESKGEIIVVDRAQANEARRQAFGLPLPSLAFLERGLKPDEVNNMAGVVKGVRKTLQDQWVFTLEDGAIWRQISGDLNRDPHAGSKVVIRKGSIGSFLMNVDGQQAIKVHRDQ